MKKTVCAVLLTAACLLTLCACGQTASAPAPAAVSMSELQKTLLAADASLPEMLSVDSSATDAAKSFTYLSTLPYDQVKDFLLSYSATGKADEIAVIQVKNAADADSAAATLRAHAEKRQSLFRQYDPTQAVRAEKALIFTQGSYAVLLICDNAQGVKTAFQTAVGASS